MKNLSRKMHGFAVIAIAGWLGFGTCLAGTAPELINYQGRLAEASGALASTAEYDLSVDFYENVEGGTSVWSEVHFDVPVVRGYFNIIIGGIESGLKNALVQSAYIVVSATNGYTTGRCRMLSVPYALSAEMVQGVDLLDQVKMIQRIIGMSVPGGDDDSEFVQLPANGTNGPPALLMGRYEVTKELWDTVYNWALTNNYSFNNLGSGKSSNHPVQTVNWYDCLKWCNARSEMEGRTYCYTVEGQPYKSGWIVPDCDFDASGYRLPTIDEWEFAARGGLANKRFPWGNTIDHSHANYKAFGSAYNYDISPYSSATYHPDYDDVSPYTSPVGHFPANGYGLYDMAGNVSEWCWESAFITTEAWTRGGSWLTSANTVTCTAQAWEEAHEEYHSLGFRIIYR